MIFSYVYSSVPGNNGQKLICWPSANSPDIRPILYRLYGVIDVVDELCYYFLILNMDILSRLITSFYKTHLNRMFSVRNCLHLQSHYLLQVVVLRFLHSV